MLIIHIRDKKKGQILLNSICYKRKKAVFKLLYFGNKKSYRNELKCILKLQTDTFM